MEQEFSVELSLCGSYLIARPLRSVDIDLARAIGRATFERGETLSRNSVLFDLRGLPSGTSNLEKYEFAQEDAKAIGFTNQWRIAIASDADNTDAKFLVTVMANAGFACRSFPDETSAAGWLSRTAGA